MNMKERIERAMGNNTLAPLAQKYRTARADLLILVAMTLVNIVLLLAGSTTYFLFSGAVPYYLVIYGMLLCGVYPGMETDPELLGWVSLPKGTVAIFVVAALLILGVYVVLYLLSKKNYHFLTAALALFALDTAAMLWLGGISLDNAIDLVFHAWMLYSLFAGVRAARTLVNAPAEDTVIDPTQYRELEGGEGDEEPTELSNAAQAVDTGEVVIGSDETQDVAPEIEATKPTHKPKIDTSNFLEFDYFDKKESEQ